jgi:hypothetical protein
MTGITTTGEKGSALVSHLLDGEELGKSNVESKLGDVLFEGRPLEVKRSENDGFVNANQVRPYRYIPLIGFIDSNNDNKDRLIVIAPNQLIKNAVGKKGQHVDNPFFVIGFKLTLSMARKLNGVIIDVNDLDASDQLKNAVRKAFADGDADVPAKTTAAYFSAQAGVSMDHSEEIQIYLDGGPKPTWMEV